MNKMTTLWFAPALLGMAIAVASSAHAQPAGVRGGWEYLNSCASCHGVMGRGDGPLARHLVTQPSDLTRLAQRNGGAFPRERLISVVDGRASTEIGPHGSREMPVWGSTFVERYTNMGVPPQGAEEISRRRIQHLVEYLESIQQK